MRGRGRPVAFAGDEPCAPAAGDKAGGPADQDQDSVLQPGQVEEVHEQPDQPGERPAETQAPDVGDRLPASDRGHVALVEVAERAWLAILEAGADGLGRVAALLHGDGRDSRQRLGPVDADHVAEREDLGMPGQRQVGSHGHPAGPVDAGSGRPAERLGEPRGAHPGGPYDGPRRDPLRGAVAASQRDRPPVDVHDRAIEDRRDAEPLQRAGGAGR